MNKLFTVVIAVFVLSSLQPAYADDVEMETTTTTTEDVDIGTPDKTVTKEISREVDDDEATYSKETTIESEGSTSTSTTTTTVDD
jgi:hypothetical protein